MAVSEASRHSTWPAGLWRLADPKISLASLAAMMLGALGAAASGAFEPAWFALTVFGILALEVAKNASGEVFDFDSGTDGAIRADERTPFSGGKRVLVDGLLTRRQTWAIAVTGYAVTLGCGLGIVLGREPRVAWLGFTGMALAFFYHAPPLRLSSRGLGEAAVALAYGPGVVSGTCLVQAHHVPASLLALSIPLGLLIAAFLLVNEFPDARADAQAGKRTLVVRLGRRRAAGLFDTLVFVALVVLFALPAFGLPLTVWVALPAFAPAVRASRTLQRNRKEPARALVPAQKGILAASVLFAFLAGMGLLLEPWW